MIEISVPGYPEFSIFFSFNKSSKEVADFLLDKDIPMMEVVNYITDKAPHENGRTTLFHDSGLIFVKMDYLNSSIRYIAILVHELGHISKRVAGNRGEEAEMYLLGYLFEEIMKKLKPDIDYTDEYRDVEFFKKMSKPS